MPNLQQYVQSLTPEQRQQKIQEIQAELARRGGGGQQQGILPRIGQGIQRGLQAFPSIALEGKLPAEPKAPSAQEQLAQIELNNILKSAQQPTAQPTQIPGVVSTATPSDVAVTRQPSPVGEAIQPVAQPTQPQEKVPSPHIDVMKWETTRGVSRKVPTTEVNPEYTKYLEKKKFLSNEEQKILSKGRSEQALQQRNFEAVAGIMQQTVASWKAAAQEKQGRIPEGFLAKQAGGVTEALGIKGFPFTKAYIGQRIETAMMLSKIITGGARIIRSVINQLLRTLPTDDMLEDDMKAKIQQSYLNSYTRALGRRLTKDERQEAMDAAAEVLETPAMTLPEMQQQAPTVISLEVDGVIYDVPVEEFENFINEVPEDAEIYDVRGR